MKIVQVTQHEIIDHETGKKISTESSHTYQKKVSSDSFYMTFIDFMAPYFKLKENAKQILVWMCVNAEFNTGKISLTTAKRKQMAEEVGICINTITNNLKTLKEANLISGEKGEFMINPQIFWKGDLKLREKLLNDNGLRIKFSIEGN